MLFPGSRICYEGAAADLATLTEELKSSGFSGHIVLEFQESVDVVICVGGEYVKVVEKIGRRLLSTKKYREIWGKCQIKAGRMTVFELPPHLARRLRGIRGRRLLRSGTAGTGCDPARVIAELKAAGFNGILDAVSPEGKLLLDFEGGVIVACFATQYDGPALEGFEAFRTWHEGCVSATRPTFFSVSEVSSAADAQLWDEILMDYADQVPLPLPSSLERLARRFGRTAAAGEVLFTEGTRTDAACYLLSGEIELTAAGAGSRTLQPGALIGVGWLSSPGPAGLTGRALAPSRYLAFGRDDLRIVCDNSPLLAARCVRDSAAALAALRARLDAYRAEPRLSDVESAVAEALVRRGPGSRAGVPPAALFRELMERLPLSLPEIDALFRKLAALGGIGQADGRITLQPREF